MSPYLFGPVYSRRLGRSLGIDLVPLKTCTYDCVYCECGRTTSMTTTRQDFFPLPDIIQEIDEYLSTSPRLDYVTLAGSGEPTLSTRLGPVIRHLKTAWPAYRIAVLTCGSLLTVPEVRNEILDADVVIPTLSTGIEKTFNQIHRPAPGISCCRIVDGIIRFRDQFSGEIWLEVFIIPGVNTSDIELSALRRAICRIHADRVQINTLDRPGTCMWVTPASPEELLRIRKILNCQNTEIIPSESRFPDAPDDQTHLR